MVAWTILGHGRTTLHNWYDCFLSGVSDPDYRIIIANTVQCFYSQMTQRTLSPLYAEEQNVSSEFPRLPRKPLRA